MAVSTGSLLRGFTILTTFYEQGIREKRDRGNMKEKVEATLNVTVFELDFGL